MALLEFDHTNILSAVWIANRIRIVVTGSRMYARQKGSNVWPLQIGEVRSPAFTKSFFSLYLGDNPVSPDAKKNIGKGLTALSSSREDPDL